jgi:RNA polymerase sigma factor (sigma-70 family)
MDECLPGSAGPDDRTSWTAILSGDVDYVIRRHWQPVFRFLRARLPHDEEAEEATQDFFLAFLRRELITRLDPAKGTCRSFVFHAVRQFLIDVYRRRSAQRRTPIGSPDPQPVEECASDLVGPPEEFDRQWFRSLVDHAREAVRRALERRGNPRAARAFELFYFEQDEDGRYTHARVAERLGIPRTQVNNQLHAARQLFGQALRELVAEYCGPEHLEDELLELARFLEDHHLEGAPPWVE